jgi:DNA-binding MarR family transcriptional regulator
MRLTYYDERVIDQLAARTHLTGEQNVVDVGTGTGFVAAGLAARRRTDTAREGLRGLFTLAALVGHAMDGGLAELGLSRARGEVIWTLHHQGAMTQRQLGEALECSAPSVTGLLDALESAGFVRRSAHPDDRRKTLVQLTDRGAATATAWSAGHDEFAAMLFADVNTSELTAFAAGLDRVLARLAEAVPTRPADTG